MNDPALKVASAPPPKRSEPREATKRFFSWFSATVTFIAGCMLATVLFWYLTSLSESFGASPIPMSANILGRLDEVKTEIKGLRHEVSYSTDEEVIFLKILYMHQGAPPIRIKLARRIAAAVRENCLRFKRDPDFVLAIIASESNFNPKAVSKAGAVGLMQVMPQWNDILRLEGDLNDINTNIHHGLLVYGFYENMYKEVQLALSAYNRGPGMVDSDLMRGKDPARNGYASIVLREYNKLKRLGGKS